MKYILSFIVVLMITILTGGIYCIYVRPYIFHKADVYAYPPIASSGPTASAHSLTPLLSNQWYSSVYASLPTAPIYIQPLAMKFDNDGIGISYPQIVTKKDEIDAPFSPDIRIVPPQQLQKIQLKNVGDWHAQIQLTDTDGGNLSATIGHGIPFITFSSNEKKIEIQISGSYSIENANALPVAHETSFQSSDFLLETSHASYIIALGGMETITVQDNTLVIPHPSHLFVGLLDTPAHYKDFAALSRSDIIGTQAFPTVQGTSLQTQYVLQTNTGMTPLLALYPHQYENLQTPIASLGTYNTLRGQLQLVKATGFTTVTPLIVPPETFAPLVSTPPDLQQQIHKDIQQVIQQGPPNSKDYYLGTWFGKIGNLLLLANSENMDQEKQQLLSYAEPIYLKSFSYFTYAKDKSSLIANKPEFGNEDLNDHHFHYGYYIRLGAIIASFDPGKLAEIKKGITPMIQDIATTSRTDTSYPFLRNFDIYESHSWADGYGYSDFGNNQESSSEAINAWYGLYLWSQVSHDTTLAQYSLYLYNSEIIGAQYYWFDKDGMYSAPYAHAIASQVWSGKVTFSTWFSSETNMKYGIQLLPFTPASGYLGSFKDFTPYQKDFAASGGSITKDWGDLFLIWQSYYAPKDALSEINQVTTVEGDNPKSLLLYEIYKNGEK